MIWEIQEKGWELMIFTYPPKVSDTTRNDKLRELNALIRENANELWYTVIDLWTAFVDESDDDLVKTWLMKVDNLHFTEEWHIVIADIFNDYISEPTESTEIKLVETTTSTTSPYTAQLYNKNWVIEMDNAWGNIVIIPNDDDIFFPIGTTITIIQYGAWITTVTWSTWVTINWVSAWSKATTAQYEWLACYKRAANEWIIVNK